MATLKEFASSDGVSKTMDPVNTGSTKRPKDNTQGQFDMNAETKAEALAMLMKHASTMGKSDIMNIFKGATALGGGNSSRPADQKGGQPMTTVQNYWAKEDVDELFTGDQFSEEFKEKVLVIFEAALEAKATVIEEEIREEFQKSLDEQVAKLEESMREEVEQYLTYVAEEWVDKNKLAIEANSKIELAESLMTGLKELFEAHNIEVSDEQTDVVAALEEKVEEITGKFNELYEDNVNLRKAVIDYQKEEIFAEISEGLVDTQADKLFQLSESISYNDLEDFKEKLATLKESVTGKIAPVAHKPVDLNEAIVDDGSNKGPTAYQLASQRLSKKF